MALYRRGRVWWYKFTWKGFPIRESTKQTNKRTAEQIEAAHKTSLAKGEVGIREKKAVPTLSEFADLYFLPHVETQFADKRATLAYYQIQVGHLTGCGPLAKTRVDAISAEIISGFVAKWRHSGYQISSINRALQVLRRMLKLSIEWGHSQRTAISISLLPGERRRERVLSLNEEAAYMDGAQKIGDSILCAYRAALSGIRATSRNQPPIEPQDSSLLRDVSTVLIDCALRPEECYRLRWEQVSPGVLQIAFGKTANARRLLPLPKRVAAILEMRKSAATSEWVFPAQTKSGHIEQSTLRNQHKKACKIAGLQYFPFYTFRHTCLTKWSRHMDPYTLAYFAGHSDFATTRRYVHPSIETGRAAMERANDALSGHNSGHSAETLTPAKNVETAVLQ